MRIRIEVQIEPRNPLWRYLVTAREGTARLHRIQRHGGPEAREAALGELATWLEAHGYPVPDHCWDREIHPRGVQHWRRRPLLR